MILNAMKPPRHLPRATGGFTLAEVAIAMGVAAGVLAILTMVMGALTRDLRRLKPYEAWKRPAFVAKSPSSGSSTSSTDTSDNSNSNSNSNSGTNSTSTPTITPTNTLPDENLDPNTRPDEATVPPDPDDPEAKDPNQPDTPAGDDTTTTP